MEKLEIWENWKNGFMQLDWQTAVSSAVQDMSLFSFNSNYSCTKCMSEFIGDPMEFYRSPNGTLLEFYWKSLIRLSQNLAHFVLDSSLNNDDLEKKIFKIVCKYLKIK